MNQPKYKQIAQKLGKTTEKLMTPMIFVGPISSIPQVYNVWFESSTGVSLISWVVFFITQIFWLIHALNLNDKQNIATGVLWLIVEFLIILGLLIR